MQIAVMGCGAMGSIYAALLASAGHEVICIDRNAAHIDAINNTGLRVSGASGDRTISLKGFVEPPTAKIDLLIIGLKAAHVPNVKAAVPMLDNSSLVLTIQNGLGSADIVADLVGADKLVVGVAQGFGAALVEPGHSHHNDMKAIRFGDYASGKGMATIEPIFRAAGFDTELSDDIAVVQWEKLMCNAAYSGPCALTGMTVGEMMDDPIMAPISQAAATETFDVAKRKGINIAVSNPVQYVRDFAARMPDAKPSVLLDIEAGRFSEIDVINGAVPREAARLGTTAPVNATITALVRALEEKNVASA